MNLTTGDIAANDITANSLTATAQEVDSVTVSGHSAFGATAVVDLFNGVAAWIVSAIEETVTNFTNRVYGLGVRVVLDPANDTTEETIGIESILETPSGNSKNFTDSFAGIRAVAEHNGTGTIATALGSVGHIENNGTGTIDIASAVVASIDQTNASGTIGLAVGVGIAAPDNVGTITNLAGILVQDHSGIGVTTSDNILSEGATSTTHFEGTHLQDGDIEFTNAAKGLILRAPGGGRWRITVSDLGVLTTTSI